ncbi:MAG: stage II sporulation protein M [Bacillota bacterium]|nr:stage II sporulation protein M [Bacillota bacterium]
MAGRIKRVLLDYLVDNLAIYLTVFGFFALGTTLGAVLVKPLTLGQQIELLEYLDSFITSLLNMEISSVGILKQALINNLKFVLYMWLLGLTVIGVPIVVGLVFARGFILGFTVSFLVQEKGAQGISMAILSVLPPNILLLPVILVSAVTAISFSLVLIRGNIRNSLIKLLQQFLSYSLLMLTLAIVAVMAAFIEAYIAPSMMKLIAVYI